MLEDVAASEAAGVRAASRFALGGGTQLIEFEGWKRTAIKCFPNIIVLLKPKP